jgi:hypothetical protein
MGQTKLTYNLQHALPHSVGPFSRHTTQTMLSLGIQHKLMQMDIYIYPIVCTNKKLRVSQPLISLTACDRRQPWLRQPTTNLLEIEFLQTQVRNWI